MLSHFFQRLFILKCRVNHLPHALFLERKQTMPTGHQYDEPIVPPEDLSETDETE